MDQLFPAPLFAQLPRQPILPQGHPTNIRSNFTGKVFCIGFNKTGSKSISEALEILGFKSARWLRQSPRESLLISNKFSFLAPWYKDQNLPLFLGTDDISWLFHHLDLLKAVKKVSREASNFGDSPWLYLYPVLQQWYPDAKFILTKRSSTFQVVNSALKMILRTRFPGQTISPEDFPGKNVFQTNLKEYLLLTSRGYERHNENVESFFNGPNQSSKLLVLNLELEPEDIWSKLARFLECTIPKVAFPHQNSAPADQQKDLLPNDFNLNWQNHSFTEKYQSKFNLLRALGRKETLNSGDWESLRNIYPPEL